MSLLLSSSDSPRVLLQLGLPTQPLGPPVPDLPGRVLLAQSIFTIQSQHLGWGLQRAHDGGGDLSPDRIPSED